MNSFLSLRRVAALFTAETLQLLGDRSVLFLIFALPVVQILLYGYGVNFLPRDVPIVLATDNADFAKRLPSYIESRSHLVKIYGPVRAAGAAEQAVISGEAEVGLEVLISGSKGAANAPSAMEVGPESSSPANNRAPVALGESEPKPSVPDQMDAPPASDETQIGPEAPLPDSTRARIRIFVDGIDPPTVAPIIAQLQLGVWRGVAECFAQKQGSRMPDVPPPIWVSGSSNHEAWAVAPGLVGVVVMISMLFLGAMALVRERERGTWEGLLATPIRPAEVLLGKLMPYLVIGMIETILLLGVVHILFGIPTRWAELALVAATPLFAGAYLIVGFVFSALAKTQLQAVQGAVGVYLPSLLLSGFLFPFSGMPAWAKCVGEAMPLTHYLRASREILLGHASADTILAHLAPIAVFTLIFTVVAVMTYRRGLD